MKFSLKELRARKNETQLDTANALGVSLTTYNSWENNVSNLKVSTVQKIASHFGVRIGDIFFDLEHENNSSKTQETRGSEE